MPFTKKYKWFFLLALLLAPLPLHAENAAGVSIEDAFSPDQGAARLVLKTIDTAQSSIEVAAYTFTSRAIAWALIKARDRGVDVRVVLDKRQQGRGSLAGFLDAHGVPVRINRRYDIMHNKFMVVDGSSVELGSFNYTRSADLRNAENVVVIHNDRRVIGDYTRQWQRLWQESQS
jgi:phosphatidylserine/phosphatidylglycerophosphate/cardiolipin synthase-like enzyme